ncbi:hypothetical protein FNV43_RR25656 [Rhamnella rubrinervis]|uniref:TF-B3 domain-containing protein n=1 Tax=Rhamnella rubrinervis TaxID=2594499 RepID=A0A8K0DI95_9ROSA|nr:hypothetical protein FNV43_RR25656 [Rhamnella rubrinervis]
MAGVFENNNAHFGAVVRNNRVRVVVANPCRPSHEPGSAATYRAARAAQTARFTESRRRRCLRIARDTPLVFQRRPSRIPIIPPPSPLPRIFNQLEMRFLFEKQLQNSDVGQAGRIVIPKKEAEMHLPALEAKEGFWMHLDDMDFLQNWTIKFRYWPNNTSRMYVFENTREFVAEHGLGFGDYIMVFKDDKNGSYLIRAKKNVVQVAADENNNLVNNAANHIPGMDEFGSPLYHGDSSYLFDTSMDFFGGALDQPPFTQHQRLPSLESINFSLFG